MQSQSPTKILIVDDHPLIRQGVSTLLSMESDFVVGGEAEDTQSALSLLKNQKIDVIILDVGLNDADGLVALKEIKSQFPEIKVLVFSGQEEHIYAPRSIRAGALGYVQKGESHETFMAALRKVAKGEIHLSKELETQFLKRMVAGDSSPCESPLETLSDRELEVFALFRQGQTGKQIAEKLNLSIKTVDAHRCHIKEKLKLETASEFVHRAVEWVKSGKARS